MSNPSLSWEHVEHLAHKMRNVVRRGYLVKTYYDKKLMQARIKTGHGIENDRIDIMHPVGYLGRVQADDKAEVFTMDVGGDSSRRVVLGVLGDREHHPKIKEGESILYSPGDPNNFLRVFKKPQKKGNGGSGGGGQTLAEGEGGEEGGGNEQSPDSKEAIYGKYGQTFCLFDGKKAQTYYEDEKKSTHVDAEHVHIRFNDLRVWIDKENIWSTKPILLKQDPDSGSSRTRDGEPLTFDWDEASNTWTYNATMVFNGKFSITGPFTVTGTTVITGATTVNGTTIFNGAHTINGKTAANDFITLHADPVLPMHPVTKRYVDGGNASLNAGKVDRAGDTMTGPLTLSSFPGAAMHAVPASWVDQNYIAYTGDTMTGPLILPEDDPTDDLQAVTKKYVDDSIAAIPPPPPSLQAVDGRIDGDVHFTGDVTFTGKVVIEGDLIVRGRIINA
jgi:cytoskeletal protein CcmA (bactofilin family)